MHVCVLSLQQYLLYLCVGGSNAITSSASSSSTPFVAVMAIGSGSLVMSFSSLSTPSAIGDSGSSSGTVLCYLCTWEYVVAREEGERYHAWVVKYMFTKVGNLRCSGWPRKL